MKVKLRDSDRYASNMFLVGDPKQQEIGIFNFCDIKIVGDIVKHCQKGRGRNEISAKLRCQQLPQWYQAGPYQTVDCVATVRHYNKSADLLT